MNAAGWMLVGVLLGAAAGTVLAALLAASRRDDELAELRDRERQAARLRLVLGASDDDGPVAP